MKGYRFGEVRLHPGVFLGDVHQSQLGQRQGNFRAGGIPPVHGVQDDFISPQAERADIVFPVDIHRNRRDIEYLVEHLHHFGSRSRADSPVGRQ